MKNILKLIFYSFISLVYLTFSTNTTYAISLDSTFGEDGKVITSFGHEAVPRSVILQPDGKAVVVGYASNGNDLDWAIIRYNTNGSIDTSFEDDGKILRDFGINDSAEVVRVQLDGKIVVGGYSQPTGNYLWTIARYNFNGAFDSSFGSNGIVTTSFTSNLSVVKSIELQLDGKIIAIGYRQSGGQDDVALARYNPDGSLDTTFSTDGIVTTPIGGSNDRGMVVVLQADGKIVVLGDFDAGGQDKIFLVRYNSDGSLDGSFGSGGKVTTQIDGYDRGNAIAIQPDGKIVVSGLTNITTSLDTYIARYNSNGTLDDVFGNNGKVIKSFVSGNDGASSMVLQQDGKIVLGGFEDTGVSGTDFALRQFNNDGTLDSSFGTIGSYVTPIGSGNDVITSIILQNDKKILAAGSVSNGSYNDWGLVRYQTDTSLDVHYFSQNDLPWGPTEYDHANLLGFEDPTMDRWGCLVTSAAMVLNYHDMTEFPDGSAIDPGSLNEWLKENNGYQTGVDDYGKPFSKFVWSSIPRLTKQLFQAEKATYKLVHNRPGQGQDGKAILENDLSNEKLPGILGVSNIETDMHFVVAKGKTSDSYSINDPEWNYPDLKSFDNNDFFQFDRYLKSNTNFSYIEMSISEGVEIAVVDPDGKKTGKQVIDGIVQTFDEIPNAVYGHQNAISNPNVSGEKESFGFGFNEFLLPEPTGGQYTIILSSLENQTYTLNIAALEADGDDKNFQMTGIIGPGANDEFNLAYFQDDPPTLDEVVTFDSLIDDIRSLRATGDISNLGVYISLLTKANVAKGLAGNIWTKRASINLLKSMQKEITKQKGKGVSETAFNILNNDIQVLIENLN